MKVKRAAAFPKHLLPYVMLCILGMVISDSDLDLWDPVGYVPQSNKVQSNLVFLSTCILLEASVGSSKLVLHAVVLAMVMHASLVI